MHCLRCGRNTSHNQIFCDACRQSMDAYPVKPGTPIHLPPVKATPSGKKRIRRKRQLSAEEQVLLLRKSLRQTRLLLVAMALVLCVAVGLLIFETNALQDSNIGRNYAVDTTLGAD